VGAIGLGLRLFSVIWAAALDEVIVGSKLILLFVPSPWYSFITDSNCFSRLNLGGDFFLFKVFRLIVLYVLRIELEAETGLVGKVSFLRLGDFDLTVLE
jgi:hypothetical protein